MADFSVSITTNADKVARLIQEVSQAVQVEQPTLFKSLGQVMTEDVKKRIVSQNENKWPVLSKWVRAKKDPRRALQGAEEFVKFRVSAIGLEVYGDTGKEWTLTQHHQGFINKADDIGADGRVTIDIVNPGPLALPSGGPFSWLFKGKAGATPARQIWPDDQQGVQIALPVASRWLEALVNRIAGSL